MEKDWELLFELLLKGKKNYNALHPKIWVVFGDVLYTTTLSIKSINIGYELLSHYNRHTYFEKETCANKIFIEFI